YLMRNYQVKGKTWRGDTTPSCSLGSSPPPTPTTHAHEGGLVESFRVQPLLVRYIFGVLDDCLCSLVGCWLFFLL
ncbi:MAG: hypothetical protein JSV15_02370, partial [Candidatus Bathyarchaeota archaeon]